MGEQMVNTDKKLFQEVVYSDPLFPCYFGTRDLGSYLNEGINLHWHDDFEFDIVLEGELEYRLQSGNLSKSQVLQSGDGVFINSKTLHWARQLPGSHVRTFFLVIPPNFLRGQFPELFEKYIRPVPSSGPGGIFLSRERFKDTALLEAVQAVGNLFPESTAYELAYLEAMCRLWRLLVERLGTEERPAESLRERRLRIMLQFIRDSYGREISVQDIAESAHISRSECFRVFRGIAQKSPLEYLTEIRLLNAARLLAEDTLPAAQVGEQVGFKNPSYFGKCFREKFGCSPKEYRQRAKTDSFIVR